MKLSKDHIQFIENYLIKNKVRYWDIRMELLDHICKATEDRMSKGMSFNDALMQAHIDFGNNPIKERLNKENTKWETNPDIYADNSGYKELIKLKYQELHNSFGTAFFKDFKKFFISPLTLIIYVVFVSVLWSVTNQVEEVNLIKRITLIPPFAIILAQICIGLLTFKKTFKSLYVLTAWSVGFFGLTFQNGLLYFPKLFLGMDSSLPAWYMLLTATVLLPIVYVGLVLYLKQLRKYTKIKNSFA